MMKRKTQHGKPGIRQKGQAMTEYVICAGIIIFALFTPVNGQSLIDMLIEAAKKNHEAKVYAIAHPAVGSLSVPLPSLFP